MDFKCQGLQDAVVVKKQSGALSVDPIEFLKEVETTYDVKSIKAKGIELWPFLRWPYASAYGNKHVFKITAPKSSLWSKIKRVRNIFYGWRNLLKKYDYLVFSDTLERRLVDGKYIDKIAESLIPILGMDDVLFIEHPISEHFKLDLISTKNIGSLDTFHILCKFYSLLNKKIPLKNRELLEKINQEYKLNVDYDEKITRFFCYKELFEKFYSICKPKAIFINCYYSLSHQAALYTAKLMNIKTIELQHGIISKEHLAYNIFTDLDKDFFPDYLLVFGDYVKSVFDGDNYFMSKENVIPIGNMYIDYINNEYEPSAETTTLFKNLRKKYKKIVAVSSQWILENELIDFLIQSASLSRDILYVFVPRDMGKDYSDANFPENIIMLKGLDVYQIIREVDIHSTMWSTCALEAPALGVPNILINIGGFAKKYYLNLLTNRDVTRFVDRTEEFVDTILNWEVKTKEEIKKLHSNFYKQNYKQNLEQALLTVESNRNPDWNM